MCTLHSTPQFIKDIKVFCDLNILSMNSFIHFYKIHSPDLDEYVTKLRILLHIRNKQNWAKTFNTSVSIMYMRFLFSYLLVVCKLLIISIKRFCCLFISSIDFSIWFNFLVKVDSSCRLSKSPLAASITSSSIIMSFLPPGSRDPSGPGRLPCSLLDWLGRKMALLSEYIYYHDSKVLATL